MATTDPDVNPFDSCWFVGADWGFDFSQSLESSFPGIESPAVSFNLGWLALEYVLARGGSGYFRRQAIEAHLASGRLHLVPEAPQFSYPIYAVSSSDIDRDLFASTLSSLQEVVLGQSKLMGL